MANSTRRGTGLTVTSDGSRTKARKTRYAAPASAAHSVVPITPNMVAAETTGNSRTGQYTLLMPLV